MKDEQRVYIKGNPKRGAEIIKTLTDLGGINRKSLGGDNKFAYYYINPKGVIDYVYEHEYSPDYLLVKEFYKKIELSEIKKWKPKNNECYYRITWIGEVTENIWYGLRNDESGYKFGNCFRTKKEAEVARDLVKSVLANRLNK